MRTILTLDDDVYQAALELSQASGDSLGKVVSKLFRRGVRLHARSLGPEPRRFPVFDVSPDAPLMTVASIDRFIEEEGLF